MRDREGGFTLIEMAVSVGLFGTIMIGMSLLFQSAFRTTNEARIDQQAKTLVQRELEEIRTLPYYVSQESDKDDVDVLDLYFPSTQNETTPTGAAGTYLGTNDVWTYRSTEVLDLEDAPPMTRVVDVQFVTPTSAGTLIPVAPVAGYDSDKKDVDLPATDTLQVTATISWTVQGRPRSVALGTLITRSLQEPLKVEASGSVQGAQISGLTFQDGDSPGVAADILTLVAGASTAFREVTGSSSQASADPIQVIERDPTTSTGLQAELPTSGESSASVPNVTTGETQSASSTLAAGTATGVSAPNGVIAAWGSSAPASTADARVSDTHTQNPEGRATVSTAGVLLNSRDAGDAAPEPAVEITTATGSVEQRSTTSQVTVETEVDVSGIIVWASSQFTGSPGYVGTVLIDSLHVDLEALAGSTTASTTVSWTVSNLRVWDPDANLGEGGYTTGVTFGFIGTCGGWVGDPALCGPNRTDGLEPFENPNPVVMPAAYSGTDPDGNAALSLAIVTGATVRDSQADASVGVSNATAGQKNVLSISTRDDITGARQMEPMVMGVGDAIATVSFISHEH